MHGYTRCITLEFHVIEIGNCARNLLEYSFHINIGIVTVETLKIASAERWGIQIHIKNDGESGHLNNGGSTALKICERKAKSTNYITPAKMMSSSQVESTEYGTKK